MSGRKKNGAIVQCPTCGKAHYEPLHKLLKGQGVCCSMFCAARWRGRFRKSGEELATYQHQWYEEHKEEAKAKSAIRYLANKEELAAQHKAYRESHKEEIAAQRAGHYRDHKEELGAKQKAYREEHKEEIAAKAGAHYQANKEEILAQNKIFRDSHKEEIAAGKKIYADNHKEEIAAASKIWRENNKERKRAIDKAWAGANIERRRANSKKYYIAHKEEMRVVAQKPKHRLGEYKRNARKANPPRVWELTDGFALAMLEGIPCFYGHTLHMGYGIDRINNKLGYTIDNVVPCCGIHNRMKWSMSQYEFMAALAL